MIQDSKAKLHEASFYYTEANTQVAAAQESFTETSKLFGEAQDILSRLALGALSMAAEVSVQEEHAAVLHKHMEQVVLALEGLGADAANNADAKQLQTSVLQAIMSAELIGRSIKNVEELLPVCSGDVWGQEAELMRCSGVSVTETAEQLEGVKDHFQNMAAMVDERITNI